MTTFLLIRHGAHILGGGTIAGRSDAALLSPLGHDQARAAAERVAHLPIAALYSSPVARARQTAEHLSVRIGKPIQFNDALAEIDFGEWSGQAIDSLKPLDRWKQWNTFRSGTRIPGGEVMLETQSRIVREMLRLRAEHGDVHLALVSHGDVIKAALAWWMGVPLDLFMRIEIGLASISVVGIGDYGPWVLGINQGVPIGVP